MSSPAEAEAMAIDGNRIVAIGDDASIAALAETEAVVVDLGGRAVFPGFTDVHSHWYQPNRLGDYGPDRSSRYLSSMGCQCPLLRLEKLMSS